jgi:hypothetical protein
MIIKVMNDNGFNRKKRTRHERYEFMKHINLADSGKFLAAAALALLLTACGGGGGDGVASGGSGLSLSITDAPVSSEDVSEVWVRFTQVIVKPSDGDTIVIDVTDNQENPYRDIELTSLSSGRSELLLGQEPLPAGNYSWIRLVIDPEYTYVVETQGGTPLVDCSSCDESHLKLNRSFVIEEGGVTAFTIDFDLRQSLTLKMPKTEQPRPDFAYKLRPTLRIEDTELASAFIYGDVTDNRSEPTDCWVYVYTGSEARVEPDDICNTVAIDGVFCAAADRPLLEAIVEDTETPGLKEFQTGYMLPDIYTVSLVCEDDDPTLDEDLRFIGETEVDASDPDNRDGTGPVGFVLEDIRELTLVKTITSDGPYTLGSSIEYGYAVTNSGNVSLAGPVTVADDLTTVTCLPVSDVGNLDDSLNPGEEITCTSTYTVIEADVSAGIVTNTATASADGTTSDEDQASADIVAP